MEKRKYEELKRLTMGLLNTWSTKDIVAEIYNLFQDNLITADQENELYKIADSEEKENSPADLWFNGHGCLDLWLFCQGVNRTKLIV